MASPIKCIILIVLLGICSEAYSQTFKIRVKRLYSAAQSGTGDNKIEHTWGIGIKSNITGNDYVSPSIKGCFEYNTSDNDTRRWFTFNTLIHSGALPDNFRLRLAGHEDDTGSRCYRNDGDDYADIGYSNVIYISSYEPGVWHFESFKTAGNVYAVEFEFYYDFGPPSTPQITSSNAQCNDQLGDGIPLCADCPVTLKSTLTTKNYSNVTYQWQYYGDSDIRTVLARNPQYCGDIPDMCNSDGGGGMHPPNLVEGSTEINLMEKVLPPPDGGDCPFSCCCVDPYITQTQITWRTISGATTATYNLDPSILVGADKPNTFRFRLVAKAGDITKYSSEKSLNTIPKGPDFLIDEITKSCPLDNTGSVLVNVLWSARPKVDYDLERNDLIIKSGSSFENPFLIEDLNAGNYDLFLKSNGSCRSPVAVNVPVFSPISVVAAGTDISCNGENDGKVILTVSGGEPGRLLKYTNLTTGVASSTTATQMVYDGLVPGTYQFKIEDQGCTNPVTKSVTLTEPPKISAAVSTTASLTCENPVNGKITVSGVSGGTGTSKKYKYSLIRNGSTVQTITTESTSQTFTVDAGTYDVKIEDANKPACHPYSKSGIVVANNKLTAAYNVKNVTCFGGSDGEVTVTAQNGIGPYIYTLNGISKTASGSYTFKELNKGSYTLTVKNSGSCTDLLSYQVNVGGPNEISFSSVQITSNDCYGDNKGSISLNVSGGSGGYTYQWQKSDGTNLPGKTSKNISNLPAGGYKLRITDSNGCLKTTNTYTITQPNELKISDVNVLPIKCYGDFAKIIVSSSGGTGIRVNEYKLGSGSWTEFTNSTNFSSGVYAIRVKDGKSCTTQWPASISITAPASSLNGIVTKNDITCNGQSDGKITIQASGGNGATFGTNYYYSLDGQAFKSGGSTYTFSNLAKGTYSIRIKDGRECVKTLSSVTINMPEPVAGTVTEVTHVECFGASTGKIKVSASGGVGSYKYSINNGTYQNSNTFSGLKAGNHIIKIKDANDCVSASFNQTINQPATGVSISQPVVERITCYNGSDGKISAIVSGGSNNVLQWQTYKNSTWQNISGANSTTVSNLSAGTYRLNVTNSAGGSCEANSTQVVLNNPSVLQISNIDVKQITCKGSADAIIIPTATGGWGEYKFYYRKNGSVSSTIFTSATKFGPGVYTIRVVDAQGCGFDYSNTITITEPSVALNGTLTAHNYNGFNVSCNGAADGRITITSSGGNGTPFGNTYTYSLNNADFVGSNQFSGLEAGDYSVRIKDQRGCEVTKSISLKEPDLLRVSIVEKNKIDCFGENTGFIKLASSGGVEPYSYSINGSSFQSSSTFNGLGEGAYSIVLEDANGCIATQNDTIKGPDSPLEIELSGTKITCHGSDNGSIKATISGGWGGYTLQWQKESNGIWNNISLSGQEISGLGKGNYRIKVTDIEGCATLSPIYTLLEPEPLSITDVEIQQVICKGDNNGRISFNASGGWGGLIKEYSADNGITYNLLTEASRFSPGTYKLRVRDSEGCEFVYSEDLIIHEPAIPLDFEIELSNYNGFEIACYNGSSGEIKIIPSGGNGGEFDNNYLFDTGQGEFTEIPIRKDLKSGMYTLKVKDQRGCEVTKQTFLNEPGELDASLHLKNQIKCFGDSSGFIDVGVSGGVTPYLYKIDDKEFQESFKFVNLPAGTYTIQVVDANGCFDSFTENIIQPNPKLEINFETKDISCFEGNDGEISVVTNGGKAPYNYTWKDIADNVSHRVGLTAGNFHVEVSDSEGCLTTDSVRLNQPDEALTAAVTTTSLKCFGDDDGVIEVEAKGGTYPYTYSFDGGLMYNGNSFADGLSAAEYLVQVKDSNGCLFEENHEITQPDSLQLKVVTTDDVLCNGDSTGFVAFHAAGGVEEYKFSINGSMYQSIPHFDNLPSGTFQAEVLDNNGCTQTLEVFIDQPLPLEVSFETSPVICKGDQSGQIEIEAAGGAGEYTYLIDEIPIISQQKNDLFAGDHELKITDAHECVLDTNFTIIEPNEAYHLTLKEARDVTCYGYQDGTIEVQSIGGYGDYEISFDDGEPSSNHLYSNLDIGTYTITGTDSVGCEQKLDVFLQQPDVLELSVANSTDVLCHGDSSGSIELSVQGGNGGYIFSNSEYSQNEGFFDRLIAGEYKLYVEDGKGCADSVAQTLVEPEPLMASIYDNLNAACGQQNGEAKLSVEGGIVDYDISWINWEEDTVFTGAEALGLYAGRYNVIIKDAHSCYLEIPHIVADDEAPEVTLVETVPVSCYGGSDGEAEVIATGGAGDYIYVWSDSLRQNLPRATELRAGNYSLRLEDGRGCAVSMDIYIDTPEPVKLELQDQVMPSCHGSADGELIVKASGGTNSFIYSWSEGISFNENHAFELISNTYQVSAEDENGCKALESFFLEQPPMLEIDTTYIVNPTCHGNCDGTIQLFPKGGTGNYSYQWEGLSNNTDSVFSLCEDIYTAVVTDENGCSIKSTSELIAPEELKIAIDELINATCSYSQDGFVSLASSGGTFPYVYSWADFAGYTDSIHTTLPKGEFHVDLLDANGCRDSLLVEIDAPDTILIDVIDKIDPLCFGDCNGYIAVDAKGGTGNFSFSWNNGSENQAVDNICSGEYTVVVKDENYCSSEMAIFLDQPSEVNVHLASAQPISCYEGEDGEISVYGSGGTGDYEYLWQGEEANISTIKGLSKGTYKVIITDEHGCKDSLQHFLDHPLPVKAKLVSVTEPTCKENCDGKLEVLASGGNGGYTYTWPDIAQNDRSVINICEGDYKVIITDSLACKADTLFHLNAPPKLAIDLLKEIEPECSDDCDGAIEVVAYGGTAPYTYNWLDHEMITGTGADQLCADVYTVEVLDINECVAERKILLDGPDMVQMFVLEKIKPSCNEAEDGSIKVAATGGTAPYKYEWLSSDHTGQELKGIGKGQHLIKITDAMGCVVISEIELTAPAKLTATVVNSAPPICSYTCDGWAEVSASGGTGAYHFKWNDENQQTGPIARGLCPGTYEVEVTDKNGCVEILEVIIESTPEISIDLGGFRTLCKDQEVVLNGGLAGFAYQWTSDNGFESNDQEVTLAEAGSYYLNAISPDGCIARDTFEVFVDEKSFEVNFLAATELIVGDTLLLTEVCYPVADYLEWEFADPAIIVEANEFQPQISYHKAGTYPVSLTAYHGECFETITKQITFYDPEEAPDLNGRILLGETGFKNVKLYPNPTDGKVSLEVTMHQQAPLAAFIYDNSGVELYRISRDTGIFFRFSFDISKERNGVYFVKLVSNNDMSNLKIVKSE